MNNSIIIDNYKAIKQGILLRAVFNTSPEGEGYIPIFQSLRSYVSSHWIKTGDRVVASGACQVVDGAPMVPVSIENNGLPIEGAIDARRLVIDPHDLRQSSNKLAYAAVICNDFVDIIL